MSLCHAVLRGLGGKCVCVAPCQWGRKACWCKYCVSLGGGVIGGTRLGISTVVILLTITTIIITIAIINVIFNPHPYRCLLSSPPLFSSHPVVYFFIRCSSQLSFMSPRRGHLVSWNPGQSRGSGSIGDPDVRCKDLAQVDQQPRLHQEADSLESFGCWVVSTGMWMYVGSFRSCDCGN